MKIINLNLNNNHYRYSVYENKCTDEYGILLLGALQEIESVESFSQHFSKTLNTIVIEAPGTGKTPPIHSSISIHEQAKTLLDIIKYLNIEKAHIFAFSYATALSVELCHLWGNVQTLSIAGGVPGIPESGRAATLNMIADAVRDKKQFAHTFVNSLTSDIPTIPRNKVIKRSAISGLQKYDSNRINSFIENSIRLLVHRPSSLSAVVAPCLICVGEHDPYVTQEVAYDFFKSLSNAHFLIIKNADHLMHLQYPEKIAQAMITLAQRSVATKAIFNGLAL